MVCLQHGTEEVTSEEEEEEEMGEVIYLRSTHLPHCSKRGGGPACLLACLPPAAFSSHSWVTEENVYAAGTDCKAVFCLGREYCQMMSS